VDPRLIVRAPLPSFVLFQNAHPPNMYHCFNALTVQAISLYALPGSFSANRLMERNQLHPKAATGIRVEFLSSSIQPHLTSRSNTALDRGESVINPSFVPSGDARMQSTDLPGRLANLTAGFESSDFLHSVVPASVSVG
jgi:hypothetical protein